MWVELKFQMRATPPTKTTDQVVIKKKRKPTPQEHMKKVLRPAPDDHLKQVWAALMKLASVLLGKTALSNTSLPRPS